MKTIIISACLGMLTIGAFAQNDKKEKESETEYEINFRDQIEEDFDLTDSQAKELDELNSWTLKEIANIADAYEINSEVYDSKLSLIMEKRDAKLEDILTLEQYAIYMNSVAAHQSYDSKYKDGDVTLKKSKDGDVTMKSDKGTVKISDEKVVVKNKETQEKMVIKKDEIEYSNDKTNSNVEIEEDEVDVSTPAKKTEVTESAASETTDSTSVKIKK